MTNVAAALSKPATDTSNAGLLGKSSPQSGEADEFSQILSDSENESPAGSAVAKDDAADEVDSQPRGMFGRSRFQSLNELNSLNAAGTAATADTAKIQQPATAQGQATQQAQTAQSQPQNNIAETLARIGLQQSLQPVGAGQIEQPVAGKPPMATAEGAQTLPEETAEDTNLLDLVAATVGAGTKRLPSVASGQVKEATAPSQAKADGDADETSGADVPSTAASDASPLASSLSTEALLQLTALPANSSPVDAPEDIPDLSIEGLSASFSQGETSVLEADDSFDLTTPQIGTDDASEGKAFRFQKAGDTTSAVTLSIAKAADGATEVQDEAGGITRPETVTVLDSRRYLGFGVGQNASNLLSAVSKDSGWAAAMHASSAASGATGESTTGNVVNTLKLQLNPENMGTITANMRLQGEELSIHLTVHNAAAYRELNEDRKPMMDALRAQGFNVDQVTVSIAPAADASSNASSDQSQNNNNPQAQQQQFARDGEAARQQAQGQDRSSGQQNRNDMEKRNEPAVEAGVGSSNSSGDIYL